jgi:hypothetical protein
MTNNASRTYLLQRRGTTPEGKPKAVVIQSKTEAHARVAVAQLIRDDEVGSDSKWSCRNLRSQVVIYQ